MNDTIVAAYCLFDDILRAFGLRNDPQCRLVDAEIMTIALVAARFYGGNYTNSLHFLIEHRYLASISLSRFIRRLHRIRDWFLTIMRVLGQYWSTINADSTYIIDSFPIPCCDNIRIRRSRRYRGEVYRGYIASKKRYFYGIRIHLMCTADGKPIDVFLAPGSYSDTSEMQNYHWNLPAGSWVIGDKAYTHYAFEDELVQHDIHLMPLRKSNLKRKLESYQTYFRSITRKTIETVGSSITRRFPKTIHAVTAAGFELKVVLFVCAYAIDCV